MKLLFKLSIANLLDDVSVSSLIDLEGFAAVWANDFIHFYVPLTFLVVSLCALTKAFSVNRSLQ